MRRSRRSICNSRKWNKLSNATGGTDVNEFPLSDKYVKFDNFDNCIVGTACNETK